jgi:hypothetical protein
VTNRAPRARTNPRRSSSALPRQAATALGVFLLALLLVTGTELVIGHPVSGGKPGQTTMSALFVSPGR